MQAITSSRGDRRASRRNAGNVPSSWLAGAFTVMELLVVIAIIGVLATLLLPSLARAKASAKRAFCQNNLRELAVAMEMYGSEYDRYPPLERLVTYRSGMSSETTLESLWNAYLLPFTSSNRAVFDCPAFPEKYRWTTEPSAGRCNYPTNIEGDRPFCYGANITGISTNYAMGLFDGTYCNGTANMARKPDGFVAPADMISFGDDVLQKVWASGPSKGKTNKVAWGRLLSPLPIGESQEELIQFGAETIHSGGANMAFLDGHVEAHRAVDWFQRTDRALRRWNFDNQPHAEFWQGP